MIEKAKQLVKTYYPYLYELRDVRVAGLMVFVVVVLLISWSGVKSIDTNYQLQKEISRLQQENAVYQLGNSNTQLQNEYFKTNQYLELSARQNLGLALPGETELLVPKNVALQNTVQPPAGVATTAKASNKQPMYQKNLQSWVDFFLHRPNVSN